MKNEFKTEIKPYFDIDEGILTFETRTSGIIEQHFKETVNFKDKTVREALIKLGWTPPKDKK